MNVSIIEYSQENLNELINSNEIFSNYHIELNDILKENECSIIYVEDDFTDLEIVSEYNMLYSKTFSKNPRLTKRLHFFKNISLDDNYIIGDEFFIIDNDSFADSYLGYITLRPFSKKFIIGPSFFRFPTLIEASDVSIKKLINFNGEELLLEGMPFIQQDGNLFSCVESSIWILLELFETQFTENTLESISKKLYGRDFIHNPHNQIGVSANKISDFFQEKGYRCSTYSKDVFEFNQIIEELTFMLDSQIPVLGALLLDDSYGHLILFIGYREDKRGKRVFKYFDSLLKLVNEISVKDLKNRLQSLITVNSKDIFLEYRFYDIFLEELENLMNINTSNYKIKKAIVKSKRFKKYVAFSKMEKDLKAIYLNSNLPESILLIQFFNEDSKLASGEIIVDTTSIQFDINSCLFANIENKFFMGSHNGNESALIGRINSNEYESFSHFDKGEFIIKELPTVGAFKTKLTNESFKEITSKFKKNTVLVLGKDTEKGIKILRNIQEILKELGYDSILVKDLEDIPSQSNEEKVRLCTLLAKFTILENSYPSGGIAELSKICSTSRVVTATLREKGKGSSYMVSDYDIDYKHIKEFEYDGNIKAKIVESTQWAEKFISDKIDYLNKNYYWRK